jgi:hypothetical protein
MVSHGFADQPGESSQEGGRGRRPAVVLRVSEDAITEGIGRTFSRRSCYERTVLGTRSRGVAVTEGTVEAKLQDAEKNRVRVEVQIRGTVTSHGRGVNGPAILHTRVDSRFTASKTLHFDGAGLSSRPAEIDGTSRMQLLAVCSKPPGLRGRLVRAIARKRAARTRPQAERIIREKTLRSVRRQIDQAIDDRIQKFRQRLKSSTTLKRLAEQLDPQTLVVPTTTTSWLYVGFVPADGRLNVSREPFEKYDARPIQIWLSSDPERGDSLDWFPTPDLLAGTETPLERFIASQQRLFVSTGDLVDQALREVQALFDNVTFRRLGRWTMIGLSRFEDFERQFEDFETRLQDLELPLDSL